MLGKKLERIMDYLIITMDALAIGIFIGRRLFNFSFWFLTVIFIVYLSMLIICVCVDKEKSK